MVVYFGISDGCDCEFVSLKWRQNVLCGTFSLVKMQTKLTKWIAVAIIPGSKEFWSGNKFASASDGFFIWSRHPTDVDFGWLCYIPSSKCSKQEKRGASWPSDKSLQSQIVHMYSLSERMLGMMKTKLLKVTRVESDLCQKLITSTAACKECPL